MLGQQFSFRNADTLTRILFINIVVFLALALTKVLLKLFLIPDTGTGIIQWLAMPADAGILITRPWTILTYMFVHTGFFHILFNMLWLYWMGKLLVEYLGAKKLVSTYILGGIAGAILYILSYNFFPLFKSSGIYPPMIGASASVLAITVAIATLIPNYKVFLILIGPVSLKYIAGIIVLLDIINLGNADNVAHFAHLGGALFGFIYIVQLKKGNDLAGWFNKLFERRNSSRGPRGNMKVKHRRSKNDDEFLINKKASQERIDEILDKISKSGYGSLTKEERDFLFQSSKED